MRFALALVMVIALTLAGCAGVQYTEHVTAVTLRSEGQSVESRVLAKADAWKNSGVVVEKGKKYKITGKGRWTAGGACGWTGPDGVGAHNVLCWDIANIIKGWGATAVIAKIGETGLLFAVGGESELIAQETGTLFFRVNDGEGLCFDNEGHVDMTVSLAGGKEKPPARITIKISYPTESATTSKEETSFVCTVESANPLSEVTITINGKPLPQARGLSGLPTVKGRKSVPVQTQIPLDMGENVIVVAVTDESGSTEQKVVNVTRSPTAETAALPRPPRENVFRGQRWAVVVGISSYKNSNEIPNLRYADKDASDFYEFLRSPGGGGFPDSHVRLLMNEKATFQAVRDALFTFLQKAIEEDLVVIYISGHGAPDPNNRKNLYLLTYDTNVEQIASTAFPMWDLETAVQRQIKAQKIVVFTDTCHAGGVGGGIGMRALVPRDNPVNRYLLGLAQAKKGVAVFTASEAGEQSMESERWGGGHGVFTYHLLEALKGGADYNKDGIISLGEAMDYTSERVRRDTNSQQHPDTAGMFDRSLPMAIVR
ncbi:MAG: caspase family protein [Thermodesulfobacteriota bacterium]